MVYDDDLAARVRVQFAVERGVTEQATSGGVAFLLGGLEHGGDPFR